MKYVVLVAGAPPFEHEAGSAMVIGPFDTMDEAYDWADDNCPHKCCWVRELVPGD